MTDRHQIEVTASDIKIRIHGIPHLILRRSEVVGVQGYIKNVGPIEPIYFIEITTKTAEIICDYKDRCLWESILGGIADARVFDERLGEAAA